MLDPGRIKKLQKELQVRMEEMEEQLKEMYVEGTAGGGVITVVANGNAEVTEISIKKEAIDPDDPEMLQDLVMAATNMALEKSRELKENQVSAITGGLKIPFMF